MGSYYLRAWHMRWFSQYAETGVEVRDLGEEWAGFSLAGRNQNRSLNSLQMAISANLFMGCGTFDIGLLRTRIGRLSVAGELGYEINCRMGDHIALRRLLLAAGFKVNIREYGFNALLSLRLEKSFGIWSAEFTQLYTPGMTGMDRFMDWNGMTLSAMLPPVQNGTATA